MSMKMAFGKKIEELQKDDKIWIEESTWSDRRFKARVLGNFPDDRKISLGIYGPLGYFIWDKEILRYGAGELKNYKYLNA